jgi:hypothetical protein
MIYAVILLQTQVSVEPDDGPAGLKHAALH